MKTQALFLASFNRLLLEERSWLSFTAFTSNTLSEGRTLKDDVKINMVMVTLTTTSPPILLRVMLVRKIVCILNYRTSVLFPSQRNAELRN